MTAPTAPAPQPDSKKAADPGTDYVILVSTEDNHWANTGTTISARSTDAAILKFSESKNDLAGIFVAIPASRFKPVKVTPQTVTTLKLEEAK